MPDIETTVVVFPLMNSEAMLAVLSPSTTCGLTLEEIALKDVPEGIPFKYMDAALLPEDQTFRNAWEVDFTTPDGVGAGAVKWFAAKGIAV
jgi:hypothetical protein